MAEKRTTKEVAKYLGTTTAALYAEFQKNPAALKAKIAKAVKEMNSGKATDGEPYHVVYNPVDHKFERGGNGLCRVCGQRNDDGKHDVKKATNRRTKTTDASLREQFVKCISCSGTGYKSDKPCSVCKAKGFLPRKTAKATDRRTKLHKALDAVMDRKRVGDVAEVMCPKCNKWTPCDSSGKPKPHIVKIKGENEWCPGGTGNPRYEARDGFRPRTSPAPAPKKGYESFFDTVKRLKEEKEKKAGAKDAAFKPGDKVWANPIGKSGGTVKGIVSHIKSSGKVVIDTNGRATEWHPSNVHLSNDVKPVGDADRCIPDPTKKKKKARDASQMYVLSKAMQSGVEAFAVVKNGEVTGWAKGPNVGTLLTRKDAEALAPKYKASVLVSRRKPVGDAGSTYDVSYALNGPMKFQVTAAQFQEWARKNKVDLSNFKSVLEGLKKFTGDPRIKDWEMDA